MEVIEAIDVLKGKKGRLTDLCLDEASQMVSMAKNISKEEAMEEVKETIITGKAYNKFLEFIKYQGGDIDTLKVSDQTIDVLSTRNGILRNINAYLG